MILFNKKITSGTQKDFKMSPFCLLWVDFLPQEVSGAAIRKPTLIHRGQPPNS